MISIEELKSAYATTGITYHKAEKLISDHRKKYGRFPSQSILKFIEEYLINADVACK